MLIKYYICFFLHLLIFCCIIYILFVCAAFGFLSVCRATINEKLFNEKIRILCFMLEAGMNGHLAKLIDLLKMIELLREIFGEEK